MTSIYWINISIYIYMDYSNFTQIMKLTYFEECSDEFLNKNRNI